MDISAHSEDLLKKIYDFYRLTKNDSDEKIQRSIQDILHLWPDVLAAGDHATDDELFVFNVSRAVLFQVFSIASSKEFFYKDQILNRDIFFTCFDILSKYADIFRTTYSIYIDSNVRLLMKILSSITSIVPFEQNDLTSIQDQNLLIAIREHIDQDLGYDDLTDGSISFIWNLSDRTNFVPILLQTGYTTSVLQWIEQRKKKFRDEKVFAPIHILHNLLRHDDGIDRFNELNTKTIIETLENDPALLDNDLVIHLAMIRALLSNSEQIKNETDKYSKESVQMLVELTLNAAIGQRYRFDGSHVSEPLTVIVKLFANQQILEGIFMNNETNSITIQTFIDIFVKIFEEFYSKIHVSKDLLENYTCVVILNLWNLIFEHEIYRRNIENREQLLNILNRVINDEFEYIDTFMPRTMKGLKEAATNIQTNFNREN